MEKASLKPCPCPIKVARDSFGLNKMRQFFCQNLLIMAKPLENEIILGGHSAPFFQKMGPNIAIFDLLNYGVNGKTVTCFPLGSNFDNF